MRKLLIALALATTLAGCGHMGPKVAKVATPVTCKVTLPPKPDFAFGDLPEGADLWAQVTTLLADRRQRIDYERKLTAAGEACS